MDASDPTYEIDVEALLLPWRVVEGGGESDDEYTAIVNSKGQIVTPGGSGSPDWMNGEWTSQNEAEAIVRAVNQLRFQDFDTQMMHEVLSDMDDELVETRHRLAEMERVLRLYIDADECFCSTQIGEFGFYPCEKHKGLGDELDKVLPNR